MGTCVGIEPNISDILDVDPEGWRQNDVIEWLKSTGNGELVHLILPFKQHKIDGLSLIKLTTHDLINELEIKSYDVRKLFIDERNKLIENYKIDIANSTEQSSDSHSRTCSIFKTPNPIDEEFSDEASEFGLKDNFMQKSLRDKVQNYGKAQKISQILYKNISLCEEHGLDYQIKHKANIIKQQNTFNGKDWNFNLIPFSGLKKLDKEYENDYHVLQQYENYCYLYASELVIDWYFNQFETRILNDAYIIPKEIRSMCYKYYFEYEYHILQFAYDISNIVDHIDVYYGGPLTFTGIALIDILKNTHFRKKYRLQTCTYINILIGYVNELVTYGFIERVAIKRKKGIFYAVNNNFYSLQQIEPNDNDIKNTLYRYNTSKKEEFDKYWEFVQNKYDRNAWSVGTIIQIYIGAWKEGKIIDIDANNKNNIVVQYGTNNDNIDHDIVVKYGVNDMKLCRRVNKNDDKIVRSSREFILNRQKWAIGTNVQVFDMKHNMWFSGKIKNIIKPTQFQVNASIKAARKRIKNKKAALFCVSHNTLFEPDKISYFGTWEANIRDASSISTQPTNSDTSISSCRYGYKENRKHMIWFGFIRQHAHIMIPKDIINLIHKFCEVFIVWTVESSRVNRLLNCCYGGIIIGPSLDISDENHEISFQLTLYVRDNDEYILCYLESKHIAPYIKTLTFSLQLFCAALQHDCRGTVFYNANKKVKYNAWSWGKTNIPFKNIEKEQLKSLSIECAINIINIEYQDKHKSNNIYNVLPYTQYILKNTQYTWNIDNDLLSLFKNASIHRKYFNESLLNCCWMISCEPQGINDKSNDNNVYLTLHLMKLPFKTLSKCVRATYQWEVYANNTVFKSKWRTDKFKLNMKDGFHQSQQTICMCSSALLTSLASLTFKINIILNNNHVIHVYK